MSKKIYISYPSKNTTLGSIQIPGSKSESNRALLINALCSNGGEIKNLSSARDTQLMQEILKSSPSRINTKDAGTVMRFLTTFFSLTNQPKKITGSLRMKERPIKKLIDALRKIGVIIEYVEKEGFPPLIIKNYKKQQINEVTIDGSTSSQYISALIMLAPILNNGLTLTVVNGGMTSKPYVEMTVAIMKHFGVNVDVERGKEERYKIKPSSYSFSSFTVEPDWSSASYWYSIFVLSETKKLEIVRLKESSLQGDRALVEIMDLFGVNTTFSQKGALLTRKEKKLPSTINFSNTPDLAQTVVVLCAGLEHPCSFLGLHTLKIKETNRTLALKNELKKLGGDFIEDKNQWNIIPPKGDWKKKAGIINTYNDHRMAMAFAPLACILPYVEIENPDVVEKSYPSYWSDLKKAGFKIKTDSEKYKKEEI